MGIVIWLVAVTAMGGAIGGVALLFDHEEPPHPADMLKVLLVSIASIVLGACAIVKTFLPLEQQSDLAAYVGAGACATAAVVLGGLALGLARLLFTPVEPGERLRGNSGHSWRVGPLGSWTTEEDVRRLDAESERLAALISDEETRLVAIQIDIERMSPEPPPGRHLRDFI